MEGADEICQKLKISTEGEEDQTKSCRSRTLSIFSCPLSPDNELLWCTSLESHQPVFIKGKLPSNGKAVRTYIACYL